MEVQTRSNDGTLKFFETVKEAFEYAKENSDIWKVSFDGNRFVRIETVDGKWAWAYRPLLAEVLEEALKRMG